jgi:hypothetical protein
MHEELARVIQERTGLDEATAQQVATAVIDFLKTKLPPELAPILTGGQPDLGGLGGQLGGLFGGRSD